jgi:cupin 2 domain-containing protein
MRTTMKLTSGHLLSGIALSPAAEVFEPLVQAAGLRLERIISTGQTTPSGEWLVQDWDEWVLLLAGAARLLIEGDEAPRELRPDDWINIPAGVRHRVEWTSKDPPTVWLALHYNLP